MKPGRWTVAVVIALLLLLAGAGRDAAAAVRFFPVDLVIDTGNFPLAAWQAELTYDPAVCRIVGIEGGEGPFTEAPVYDPKGLSLGRISIASFTLAANLPKGRVRVARVHLQVDAGGDARLGARLVLAAGSDGEPFAASIGVIHGDREKP